MLGLGLGVGLGLTVRGWDWGWTSDSAFDSVTGRSNVSERPPGEV